MRIAPVAINEELRLQDLHAHDILDTDFEKEFDDLIELVTQICGCPIAAINFVDKERVWMKARKGVDGRECPRDQAFCSHAILEVTTMVVNDSRKDPRFHQNPLLSQLQVIFYAGTPIVSSNGYTLGTVCIMDQSPRSLSKEQDHALQTIAAMASRLLELRLKNRQLKISSKQRVEFERQVSQDLLQQQEAERQHLATELHENIAQALAASHLCLGMLEATVQDPLLAHCRKQIADSLEKVRELSYSVTPTTLSTLPFQDVLQMIGSRASRQYKLPVDFNYKGIDAPTPADTQVACWAIDVLFDIFLKSGKVNLVELEADTRSGIQLLLKLEGRDTDLAEYAFGKGINKIVSILDYRGGSLDISPLPNNGCQILITMGNKENAQGPASGSQYPNGFFQLSKN